MKMKPASIMINRPVISVGIPKAESKAVEIEFACTITPIKPNAMMVRIENRAAIGLLPNPCLM